MNDYLPTVYDRLTEPDFRSNQCRFTLQEMEARVFRDLEDLLNTRRAGHDLFEGLEAVEHSVANFGLRDLSHVNEKSDLQRLAYADHVRDTIEVYDPRLTGVTVSVRALTEEEKKGMKDTFRNTTMYFRVTATLRLGQGVAQPVVFDTLFDAGGLGRHAVTAAGGGA